MIGRGTLVATAAAAALALTGSAEASHQGAAQGPHDFAVGSGRNHFFEAGGPVSLQVSAHLRADGTVTGHVHGSGDLLAPLPGGDFRVEGEVTCVRVAPKLEGTPGTRASIKYRYKRSHGSLAPPEGGGVEVYVEDNGHPVGGRPVDANGTGPPMTREAFEAADPQRCTDPNLAGQPFNPLDSGDYTVHDAGA